MTFHRTTADSLATVNDNTVRGYRGFDTQLRKAVCHHLNAVTLFDPQLLGTPKHCTPLSAGCSYKQYRELINGQRNLVFRNVDTLQAGRANTQVSHRLPTDNTLFENFDISPHLAQRSEERRVGKECRSRWAP